MPEQDNLNVNSIDAWAAVRAMLDSKGWKLFIGRYSKKGDVYLTEILKPDLPYVGANYSKRDLLVHQLEALGTVKDVLNEFEVEAKNAKEEQDHKAHIGN